MLFFVIPSLFFLFSFNLPCVFTDDSIDNYILVFKHGTSRHDMNNHIQLMYQQVNDLNTTTDTRILLDSVQVSSIGNFHWYSGAFASRAFESLYGSLQHPSTINVSSQNTFPSSPSSSSDILHYWVKDITFSKQEMVQNNVPSWGLDRIDQRQGLDGLYKFASNQGQGVKVYVLDTGVMVDHDDLKGRVEIGATIVGDDDPTDYDGHGTFVAGVCCGSTYGVAKGATVVSVKTLDSDGNGRLSDLLKGKTKSVVNLSLGALYNQVANDAVEQVTQLGIHVVVAAGNYGEDACLYSPGSAPGVVTVGALDRDDTISYYSNFGKCVDIFAPGTDIKSITSNSTSATDVLTGTSMAAPHVAGSMALFLAQADYTPFELSTYMKNISTLVYLEFAINNTDGNANKSVLDNAIDTGVQSSSSGGNVNHPFDTAVNILYTQPDDGQPLWAFGGQLSSVASSLHLPFFLTLIFTVLVAIIPNLSF
ncbi:peptidase S8/S53 domain-containing protein [Halteromyces radiatus]|uniref:peptidase S8/S53 domain-containing protein n=1 Tax=Halteromyces radiatus TaxID=101107 RepID=UPI00221E9BE0|nr:peptidase S8/S53 domain-containing protein [Halteromyces radiatus]KAI8098946.1 peptidase S8/S53 domain-containing protein [Halteromyces radiatus]